MSAGGIGVGEEPPGEPPTLGWCAQEVADELPQLRLAESHTNVVGSLAHDKHSPRQVRERLRVIANRFNGSRAIGVRREPIPAAYRIFYRHIGLDPDVTPTPIEQAVMARIMKGGIPSGGLIEDVLTITLLDTSVPIWALDLETLDGPLGIRLSQEAEPLGRAAEAELLAGGRLVVADASSALGLLFGEIAPAHRAAPGCTHAALFALQVAGVPWSHVEEALWGAGRMLAQSA